METARLLEKIGLRYERLIRLVESELEHRLFGLDF